MLNKMNRKNLAASALVVLWGAAASAATVPYTEQFVGFNANWEDNVNNPAAWVPAGGADGGSYITTQFNFNGYVNPFGGGPVTHRASAADGASFGAFIGDWIADGVGEISAWVRHDAPEDLGFFMRVATPGNFPGAVIESTQTVTAGVWTQVTWGIDPFSPSCSPEGGSCLSALQSVGNFQIGTSAPAGLIDDDVAYNIDLDIVSINPIPEPGTAILMGLGLAGLASVGGKEKRGRCGIA